MGLFPSNAEHGKPVNTFPQRLNNYISSIAEAIGIALDTVFSGRQVLKPSDVGVPNGVAPLDAEGKVPIANLPATQTPSPNKIPLADANGVLAAGWFPSREIKTAHFTMSPNSTGVNPPFQIGMKISSIYHDNIGLSLVNNGTQFIIPGNAFILLMVTLAAVTDSSPPAFGSFRCLMNWLSVPHSVAIAYVNTSYEVAGYASVMVPLPSNNISYTVDAVLSSNTLILNSAALELLAMRLK